MAIGSPGGRRPWPHVLAENRRAAFAFIDRFAGCPRGPRSTPSRSATPPLARHPPGRSGGPHGRSLTEVIREELRARPAAPAKPTLADLYRGDGTDPVARRPLVAKGLAPAVGVIAWEAAGTSLVGDARVDRYRLFHGEHLVIPLLHIHRETPARGRAVLALALEGKVGAADWASIRRRLDAGDDVLSFDLRGVGENRMRYRAASGDDPTLAEADETRAYFNALSACSRTLYNSLLTGPPTSWKRWRTSRSSRDSRARSWAAAPDAGAHGVGSRLAVAAAKASPGSISRPRTSSVPMDHLVGRCARVADPVPAAGGCARQ